ncbi:MAG: dgpfaetke family protein [Labilithrix sp.]|nr:dgpfaetke family protein [Labilithrix sp.]
MRYALLVYETEACVKGRDDPEYQAAYNAYIKAIYGSGVAFAGSGLQDAATTTTTFRLVGGERQIQDGPFADTKEQLAGFFLIDVPDLDKALEWAARCPSTARGGIVEVRPALEQPK